MKISSGSVLGSSQPPVPDSGALDKTTLLCLARQSLVAAVRRLTLVMMP